MKKKPATHETPIANLNRPIMLSDEHDFYVAAERDHGLQKVYIRDKTKLVDVEFNSPVFFQILAAFSDGPDSFDQETIVPVLINAEEVLFLGWDTTAVDYSSLIDAAVRGGSAVYVTIDEGHEEMWVRFMEKIRPDGNWNLRLQKSVKSNTSIRKPDYFSFEKNEFYEWAAAAPTSNLVDAIREYFRVLEYNINLVEKDADYYDSAFLKELNGIAWNFFELGPWLMEIQDQLNRRVSPTQAKNKNTAEGVTGQGR